MIELIQYALGVTGPIFLLLVLGVYLRRINVIDAHFIQVGNKLVFNITLPTMLFFSVASQPIEDVLRPGMVTFGLIITFSIVVLLLLLTRWLIEKEKSGVFIQGAFRGNMGIVGLALVVNAYGVEIIPKAGIYIAALTIAYNVLSVWILGQRGDAHILRMLKNPLIIGIVSGFVVSAVGLKLPELLLSTGDYLTQVSLPLALLCIGGSLSWQSFKNNHRDVALASFLKLVLVPVIAITVAIIAGFRQEELGILFLMIATPTATASYIMAKQMTDFGDMAAEIVAVTTVFCPLTVAMGLTILKSWQLI